MTAGARVGVVLAGGLGTRIGSQKALALLGGRPLLDHVLEIVRAAGLEPVVAAKSTSELPAGVDARVLIEPALPVHPLLGIVHALTELEQPIVVIACDMPFVPSEFLALLAQEGSAPVRVPRVAGFLQPTLARYEPGAADALRGAIERGESARAAIEAAGVEVIEEDLLRQFGVPEELLADIDTPAQLAAAELQLSKRSASSPGSESGSSQTNPSQT